MRKFALVLLLVFILAVPCGPVNSGVASELARGTAPFTLSTDGDQSSDSITSFSETTDDDVLFYPDTFRNDTAVVAYSGNVTAINEDYEEETNDYTDTQTSNDVRRHYTVTKNSEGTVTAIQQLNFDVSQYYTIDIIEWNIEGYGEDTGSGSAETHDIEMWNFTSTEWDDVDDFYFATSEDTWHNDTITAYHYNNDTTVMIRIKSTLYTAADPIVLQNSIDYAAVIIHHMTLASSEHFAEGFTGVSDWTTSDTSISSDGDLGTITENGAGSTGRAYASFSSTDYFEYYYEFNIASMTATTANLEFWDGAAYNTLKTFTAAGTYKGIISDTDAATMQRVGFLVGSEGGNIKPDYLRISPADETGWQYDGSTIEGVASSANCDVLTDGDKLNFTAAASVQYAMVTFDDTATNAYGDISKYPFIEWSISAIADGGSDGNVWALNVYDSEGDYIPSGYSDSTGTFRMNLLSDGDMDNFDRAKFYLQDAGDSAVLDYVKIYNIANWTYTDSSTTTDDYLYVDSGTLYSNMDDGTIELNHDPALSVAQATYNIYNLSTSGTAPEFSQYVSEWSSYSDDTRGTTTSGTVTDIKLRFDSTEILANIKFIEDGTAPSVVRSSANPSVPDDDESVTISAVVTDAVEVYKVYFDAIVYPVGFSDSAYYATEQSDNLWTYEFATLKAGYYCFKVQATDGANTNALTEYAYIELTVREAAIIIEEITLIGAGDDFTMMTFSARISRDCSYTIYEESASSPEADTHTGSISEPSFNIAWDKLDVTDSNVNFTIVFTNGTLTENYTSQYQVAQTTFYIQRITPISNSETVTVSGRISKLASYTVYDEDNFVQTTGSLSGLDFKITFDQWKKHTGEMVYYKITFSNGTQTTSFESEYEAVKPLGDYEGRAVGDSADAKTDRQTIEFWSFLSAFLVGVFIILFLIDKFRGAK